MSKNSFIWNMWKELKFEQLEPTIIYVDNQSAKDLFETLKSNHKTKHINIVYNKFINNICKSM
jgi:uncharacterized protein YlbG (UPF0298 family)